jgi:hypothetical protein
MVLIMSCALSRNEMLMAVREGNLLESFSLPSRKRLELTLKGFVGRFVIDYGDAKVIKRLRLLVLKASQASNTRLC